MEKYREVADVLRNYVKSLQHLLIDYILFYVLSNIFR